MTTRKIALVRVGDGFVVARLKGVAAGMLAAVVIPPLLCVAAFLMLAVVGLVTCACVAFPLVGLLFPRAIEYSFTAKGD